MKRILAIETPSSYHVLSVFLDEISIGFEALGFQVDRVCSQELLGQPFHLYEFIFCINAVYLENIAFFLPATTPAVTLLVDYPLFHDDRLRNGCLTFLAFHSGRNRISYSDKCYKHINRNVFTPHGGSKAEMDIPYENRRYQTVFFGSYKNPVEIMQDIYGLPGVLPDFSIQLIKRMLSDETISFGAAIEQLCPEYGFQAMERQLAKLGKALAPADLFFRMYTRDLLLKKLADAGIPLDVFGEGWEDAGIRNSGCVHIHKAVCYPKVLEVMADSKIVLNITPTLNGGAHERIFSAMLNGAICMTNYSSYLQETGLTELTVPYSIHGLDETPEMIRLILKNPIAVEKIAAEAKKCAAKHHTWKNRAEDIVSTVEAYKREYHYGMECYKDQDELQFWELCKFIRANMYELLLDKMKCEVYKFYEDGNGYMERALLSYNRYGYWGSCLLEEENYELLENRALALKEHLGDFAWMWDRLADNKSKRIVYRIMRYWLDYTPLHLDKILEDKYDKYFDFDIISLTDEEVLVDLGAYTGDTVLSYLKNGGNYRKIYCYDIDEGNLNQCRKNLELLENIEYRHCAVGDKAGVVYLRGNEDVSAKGIAKSGEKEIPMVCLDDDIAEPITFLKMDIEGSEQLALLGSRNHILNDHPKMAISAYYNNEDIWKIGRMIYEMDSSYRFYMRYYGGTLYPSEYVLYAVYTKHKTERLEI